MKRKPLFKTTCPDCGAKLDTKMNRLARVFFYLAEIYFLLAAFYFFDTYDTNLFKFLAIVFIPSLALVYIGFYHQLKRPVKCRVCGQAHRVIRPSKDEEAENMQIEKNVEYFFMGLICLMLLVAYIAANFFGVTFF